MNIEDYLRDRRDETQEHRQLEQFLLGGPPPYVLGWVDLEVSAPEDLPSLAGAPRHVHYQRMKKCFGGHVYRFSGPCIELWGIIKDGWDSGDESDFRALVQSIQVGDPPKREWDEDRKVRFFRSAEGDIPKTKRVWGDTSRMVNGLEEAINLPTSDVKPGEIVGIVSTKDEDEGPNVWTWTTAKRADGTLKLLNPDGSSPIGSWGE